jgi:uncharacterized repeat protein (TIGR02543 family)
MAIYKEEDVVKGEKALWPWMSDYSQPTKEGYVFDGWEYNGETYKPPFNANPTLSPFGPVNGNVNVYAIWKKQADQYYEVTWEDNNIVRDAYAIIVTSDKYINATVGDSLTISAEFKKNNVPYTAPYAAIFKRNGMESYSKIASVQNSNNISCTVTAELNVFDYVVLINDGQISRVDYDYLERKYIHAVILESGSQTYKINLIQPESASITYNSGDWATIYANFYKDDALYTAPYVGLFACVDGKYIRVGDRTNVDNATFNHWIQGSSIDGYYLIIASQLMRDPNSPYILAKKLIYAEYDPNKEVVQP